MTCNNNHFKFRFKRKYLVYTLLVKYLLLLFFRNILQINQHHSIEIAKSNHRKPSENPNLAKNQQDIINESYLS